MESNKEKEILEENISLEFIFSTLWEGKITIAGITSFCAIISIIWVLQIPNEYRASITIAPVQGSSSSLSTLVSSQLGGLASLAGIGLGERETSETKIALNIMKSWGFIEEFIEQNSLEVNLMAVKGWSKDVNELIIDKEIYNLEQGTWERKPTSTRPSKPTSWELYQEFSSRLTISQDSISGLITISLDYYSPFLAKEWVERYVSSLNNHMALRKLNQAKTNIQYLEQQIAKTSIAGMKEVFYKIIEEQIKDKMLAEASSEFSFVTVGKPMIPEEKFSPLRFQMVALATLLGAIFSTLFVFVVRGLGLRGNN